MEVRTPRALGALIRARRRELNFGQEAFAGRLQPPSPARVAWAAKPCGVPSEVNDRGREAAFSTFALT